jgi:hypothetical protein
MLRPVSVLLWVLLLTTAVGAADPVAPPTDDARTVLTHLQQGRLWGELVLTDGRIRQVKVDGLSGDTLAVREVVGPLQERPAWYRLDQIVSARELGPTRLPAVSVGVPSRHSLVGNLVLEAVIPGAGYLRLGQPRQALTRLGFAVAAVGTGLATGRAGAAGWAPACVWLELAALADLRDQVRAANARANAIERGEPQAARVLPGRGVGVGLTAGSNAAARWAGLAARWSF